MNGVADAAMSIDIINGSDGINFSSGSQSFIQQGVAERLGGVVATAGSPLFSPIKGRAMTRPMR